MDRSQLEGIYQDSPSLPSPLRPKRPPIVTVAVIVGTSVLVATTIALIVGRSPTPPQAANTEVETAKREYWDARDKEIEQIFRFDRNPVVLQDPGSLQQLIANEAVRKAETIQEQRRTPGHSAYRKHEAVAMTLAQTNALEKGELARQGQGAKLVWTNSEGKVVSESVSPDKFAAIAVLDLVALDMATTLDSRQTYKLDSILSGSTGLSRALNQTRMSYARYLAAQNLTDPAAEIECLNAARTGATGECGE